MNEKDVYQKYHDQRNFISLAAVDDNTHNSWPRAIISTILPGSDRLVVSSTIGCQIPDKYYLKEFQKAE